MEGKRKHLTLADRIQIERGLDSNKNFTEIGKEIGKDPTTVSKEVRKHIHAKGRYMPAPWSAACMANANKSALCSRRHVCGNMSCVQLCRMCRKYHCNEICPDYIPRECEKLKKPPYVCNGCETQGSCPLDKAVYSAKYANDCYRDLLTSCRQGINQTPETIQKMDRLVTPLIVDRKQSIAHIYATHAHELGCSRRTLYNYIDKGVFAVRNIDLRRAVRYKKRKKPTQCSSMDRSYRQGHNYSDFQEQLKNTPRIGVVEMDCVEGRKGGKVMLTMFFRSYDLLLIFLLDSHTQQEVLRVFDWLESQLGLEIFRKVVPLILTDGGSEFSCRSALETSATGEQRTEIFYCDPHAAWQKGGIERSHEYIRVVLPKGRSFDQLTQEKVTRLMNNINSERRDSLNGHSPFELSILLLPNALHRALGLLPILPDEVNLSSSLFN